MEPVSAIKWTKCADGLPVIKPDVCQMFLCYVPPDPDPVIGRYLPAAFPSDFPPDMAWMVMGPCEREWEPVDVWNCRVHSWAPIPEYGM